MTYTASRLALLAVALVACTGSFEGNPNLSLVVPVRGSSSYTVFCNGASQTFTAPGLLQLGVDAIQDSSAGSGAACAQVTVPGQPYDILNTLNGDNVFVSYPVLGTVQRLNAALAPVAGFTLAGVSGPLCPTRLSLSPDETKLAVLDDPADPDSGCSNTTPRAARVAVFDARTGTLLPGGLLEVASSDLRQGGQIAADLDNSNLIVLEPFAGSYRLERYTLGSLTTPPVRSDVLGGFSSATASVDLERTPSGFQAAIGGGSSAQTVGVTLGDSTPLTVSFGATVTAVLPPNQPGQPNQTVPVGPANRIVGNRSGDNSLTAYLSSSGLILKRDTRPSTATIVDSARAGVTAVDIVFTPDGFAFALSGFGTSGSSLVKLDPANLPSLPVVSSTSLSGTSALALTWVVQQ